MKRMICFIYGPMKGCDLLDLIYMDNAASSWPKPPTVIEAMKDCLLHYAANPGRGSHKMAVAASRVLFECRKNIATLFNIKNPNCISFAMNTTMALNQAIHGYVEPGDHVICTAIEHNSVRRPLEFLKKHKNVQLTYIPVDSSGYMNMETFKESFRNNTKLVICNHSSNLLGTITPIEKIVEVCKKKNVTILIDAAQTAGHLEIDVEALGIDMVAFPGHKGLLGPQGTGGLYIRPEMELEPFLLGGTGSQSEMIEQPVVRPDRYESGTPNTVGIAGLNEGVKFILKETVQAIHKKEWELTQQLMQELQGEANIEILGPALGEDKTGIVALNITGIDASEIAYKLDRTYNIAVRAGYHCTPLTHESMGTLNQGAVRFSVGYFTSSHDIEESVRAIKELARYYR